MTAGLPRREGARDSLAGQQDVQPVTLQGPGVSNPRTPRMPDTSMQSRIADQLSQWSGGKLQEAVSKQQQKDMLDGQMAYQQGQTLEDVDMGGNKWALEGYRLMDAQTISSSLLAAQREQIAAQGHEVDPDTFRAQYVNRLDAMLEGKDPRTAELVREQMASQMPTLVADHTAQHMRYLEGRNFESLERSIDVISRDPTATEQLVDFATGGEGSASAGLSDERRQAATVSGVVRAFENDNPLAYSALAKEGLLGDNLTTDQQNAIRAAQKRFESRRRTEYNEALFNGEQALMRQVERAEISPSQAVEELSLLYAEHDINMTAAEAGSIYDQATTTERIANKTTAVNVEEARLRGDFDTVARLTEPLMVQAESGGDPNAVGPLILNGANAGDRALGSHQVMPKTLRDPGFGVEPVREDTPEEWARVGRDYWAAMIRRYEGDVEAAAVAYNAGPGNADKWVKAGRDYSVLPDREQTEPYAQKIVGWMENWSAPTASDRLSIAQGRLKQTRERLAMDAYEQMAPRLADTDDAFKRGELSEGAWRERRAHLFERYEVARSEADVNHEIAVTRSVDAAVEQAAKSARNDAYKLALENAQAAVTPARLAWEDVVTDPASTSEQVRAANQQYAEARQTVFDQYGIAAVDRGNGKEAEKMIVSSKEAMDRHAKWTEEQVEIDAAVAGGYLDRLPRALQDRAFEQVQDQIVQHYTNEVGAGRVTEAQANEAVAQELNTFFAQSGMVDPQVAMRMTAAVMGPLIDQEGNPNPNIVDAIQQYHQVKAMNPHAASQMLDPEAANRAEAVLSRADNPNLIGEAVRNLGIELQNAPRIEDTAAYMARRDVQDRIDREVKNYLQTRDIGVLHAIFQNDASLDQITDTRRSDAQRIRSDETRALLTNELSDEVARLQRITPNIGPRDLVRKAAENLTQRTEIIGGDVVMLQPGRSMGEAFFGARAAEFMHDGAVNSAVMEWLQSSEAQEQYGFISGSTAAEMLPGWLQGAIDAGAGVFGADFEPAQSTREAISTGITGVRPFKSYAAPNGNIVIEILKPDGNFSEPIVVPTQRAGEMYMERRRREMTQ